MVDNEQFNQYVAEYKKLPLQEKKQIVHNEVKKLLGFVEKAKHDCGIHTDVLLNREILDLNNDNISDDDFVEAMFVYVHSIQESLGEYFNAISKQLYK